MTLLIGINNQNLPTIFSEVLRKINRVELYCVNLQLDSRILGKELVLGLSTGKLIPPPPPAAICNGLRLSSLSAHSENLP